MLGCTGFVHFYFGTGKTSLLAGHGMAGTWKRSWIHMIGFAAITAGAIYVILDLEYPRPGLVRIDTADQVLLDIRQRIK